MVSRRRFGKVRKLPSGRYQASYIGPDGIRQTGPDTFRTKTDAAVWLTTIEADLMRGILADPEASQMPLREWLTLVLEQSPTIGERWRETCERNMRLHLAPLLDLPLRSISTTRVRQWHAEALKGKGGRTSIAQSYRFLRMAFNVAVSDGILISNPCRIKGAGVVDAAERPTASPAELLALVEAISPAKYRAAILIGGWIGLRRGEIVALKRTDIDLAAMTVDVSRTRLELLSSSVRKDKKPKTKAGSRTLSIPPHVVPFLRAHLDEHAGPEYVFVGADGEAMRGNTLYQAFVRARKRAGLDHLKFHDLRHTGSTLAAAAGATTADLMKRLGHSTEVQARRYLHAVDGRDREIAQALSRIAETGDASKLPRIIR